MDTNRIFMIDPATRKIEVPEKERIIGVYQDHDSERKYFKCHRIVGDNIDLSQHRIYINYVPSKINGTFNEEEEVGSYLCEDVATDGDYVTFSWKISDNATREAGYIAFAVFAKKADADGNLETKWHTTPAIGNVLDTLPDGDQIVSRYPDIIEQIMERLDRIGEIDPEQIAGVVEEYMTAHPFEETDPTVPDWAKQPKKPTYTAEEVGADASGTAESKVSVHNTATDSHNDIRLLVQGLTERLNALADSDDETLDQMSEVVAYIKSNKSLIDAITTSKVNVSDIIDNLTTNVSNKPLSAAQGVALKALIDSQYSSIQGITEDIVKCTEQTLTDEQKNQVRENLGLYNEHLELLETGEVTFVNNESTFIIGNETDIKYILTLSNENKTYKFEGNITKTQIGPYDYEYSGTFNLISNNLPQDSSIIYNGGLLRFNSSQDINGTYTINIYNNLTTVIPVNYLPMDSEPSDNSSNPVENRVIKGELDKKITSPSTAEVGQTIIVKSVDSNGKPTEWEAADMADGGGGIHLIARVVTESNAVSIEVTGLSTTAESLSLRIYNAGSACGNGLTITVNGVKKPDFAGTLSGGNVKLAEVRAWLYRDDGILHGRAQMENLGMNFYEWPDPGEITSIVITSPYNDGTTKYFQTGTIFEIYEGVYPNVK